MPNQCTGRILTPSRWNYYFINRQQFLTRALIRDYTKQNHRKQDAIRQITNIVRSETPLPSNLIKFARNGERGISYQVHVDTQLQNLQPIGIQYRSFHMSTLLNSDEKKEYSTPELTEDAAVHKAGLNDPSVPPWQNPLHHNNDDMKKMFTEDFDTTESFDQAVLDVPPPENVDGSVAAPEYLHEIADEIVHLTMLEMSELINKIADHYGFNESMLSPDNDSQGGLSGDGGTGGGIDDEADVSEVIVEKINFDIKLIQYDATSKIKIIKEVRSLASLGLKEAKEMVEGIPKTILKDIKKEQAEEIKAKLEELGATVEIV